MGPKRSPPGQISPPRGSSGVLLGRLGRQVGLRRALWAEKRSLKIERRALGTILGSSWRVLGPFWVAFPPPWGAPGRLQEVIFGLFWDVPAEILKMSFCLSFFSHIWSLFSVLLFALCCLPCSLAGGVVHMQKTEISLVFVGRKPHAPCSGNARSNQLSGGTRNKYRWKKELKKRTHGTRKQGRQKSIFEAKMAPKMDPGGFQKRVHKTVGN